MEFRVLGPLEVAEQDRILELGALKQRSLERSRADLQRLLHGGSRLAT